MSADSSGYEVNFEPHFNVLTRSGKAHFSNIKDAICELVDNSIQATNQNPTPIGRSIRLFLIIGRSTGTSFLVVWDNGCGMDAQVIMKSG
jgi:sensor histidine kinase regulating citrate/malate metabolism